jgi:PAS domain S-box-containing protein
MLNRILESLNDCAFAFNQDEVKYSFISNNVIHLTGYAHSDFSKDEGLLSAIIDPRDMERVIAVHQKPVTDKHTDTTYRITTAQGTTKWVNEKRSLFTDMQSGHKMLLTILKDIQREDDAKYNQEESINGYRILFDHNPSPMWIFEVPTLRILKVNNAALKTYGYTEEEFLAMTIMDLRLEKDRENLENYLAKNGIAEGGSNSFISAGVWKHMAKNGQLIYAEINGDSINYKNYDCRITVATNITQEVYYREQVKLREQFLNSLIDSQTNFLVRIDINGMYTYVNKQFRKIFRYKDEEILGKHFSITALPEELHLCETAFYKCITNVGKVTRLVHKKPDKFGKLYDTEWEFIAIVNENGEVTGVQGIGLDVTEREKVNKAIFDQNERLRNIASLSSHELRRPVATMLGLLNIFDRNNFYNPDNKEIIEHLLKVGTEIDDVIREIVGYTFTKSVN